MKKYIEIMATIILSALVLIASNANTRRWILNYYRRCAMKIKNVLKRIVMKLTDMCQKHVG